MFVNEATMLCDITCVENRLLNPERRADVIKREMTLICFWRPTCSSSILELLLSSSVKTSLDMDYLL